MSFQLVIPDSASQLHDIILKIHQNRSHVKSVKVDTVEKLLRVDLDTAANWSGHSDVQVPLIASRVMEAKVFVTKIMAESNAGTPPHTLHTTGLFDCIDRNKSR